MRVLRGWVAPGLCACVLSLAAVAPAAGQQPPIELKPSFTLKVGKHVAKLGARHVALSGSIGHVQPAGVKPAQIISGRLWLPRGLRLRGGDFPTCSGEVMRRDRNVDSCPRRSIVGRPSHGTFDHASASVVDGFGHAEYQFVNGGARRIWAFMTLYNPAIVQEPVAIDVRELRGRRWSYRLDFKIPQTLMVIAGVPVSLFSFDFDLDGIERAPGYITLKRRCPKRSRLSYRASLTFLNNNDGTTSELTKKGAFACHGERSR
jgi:hypothetical protein